MVVISEDLPDPANSVTLDPDLADGDGIPAPKITTARRQQPSDARHTRGARPRGAGSVGREPDDRRAPLPARRLASHGHGAHGNRPAKSVVNEWRRSHDVKNLFIVDGSIFVHRGSGDPTNTIQALALYVADRMKENLANLFD
jgi:choline dehydrogenase-like flavoprotein